MTIINTYQNGNYQVTIHKDGTKIREYEDTPEPLFPESVDVKITNYCDAGCKYCHEKSTTQGLHGNLDASIFSDMAIGTELAIGGGNPLDHPDLIRFLTDLKSMGIIANLTVNAIHLESHGDLLKYLTKQNLVTGVGISYQRGRLNDVIEWINTYRHTIVHMIMGVDSFDDLLDLPNHTGGVPSVLVLGYKNFGRGENFYKIRSESVDKKLYKWQTRIHKCFHGMHRLSFDNLALDQLKLKRFFPEDKWKKFYMGNEGEFTMYVDMVERTYSVNSTSHTRYQMGRLSIGEMFQNVRKEESEIPNAINGGTPKSNRLKVLSDII